MTRFELAADRAVEWLAAQLREDGSYGPQADDLACYYKSPYLFQLVGRTRDAARLLAFIQRRFMRADHDFTTAENHKSGNPAFTEYWAYPNGWLAMTAQRMGRFDVAYPAWDYLRSYHDRARGGFFTGRAARSGGKGETTDALTTAHLGLLCLFFGDIQRAEGAGRWLAWLLEMQPDPRSGLFLRRDRAGSLVREFPDDAAAFHVVSAHQPDQAYFMIGYPIAFLAKLFQATRNADHLRAACGYLDFVLSCEGDLRSSPASHQVAWGAAVLSEITADPRGAGLASAIADHLLAIQDPSGAWLISQPAHTTFDQTAEVAIWLREISGMSR
ncbi:MAG TPA: hypothetical protein VFO16_01840 [Pseudonocardiaceae bacterium]|nr:hypothetical protein [Pseudonocardiaceae bacterium]